MSTQTLVKPIEIRDVLEEKQAGLSKKLPNFVINYLKRIVHQDLVNEIIMEHGHLKNFDFIDAIIRKFDLTIKVRGRENIGADGRYIIAANHPLGGLDGVALMKVVGAVRPNILFPVNDILTQIPNMRDLFVPVNKHGSNMGNARLIDEAFASDATILFFPAGLVSRKTKGVIKDLEWKPTFIKKARSHKRDIIPTYISGSNSWWFYFLANWRKRLGIKTNIEMLYLMDEVVKQKDKEICITFGEPIPYTQLDRTKKDTERAKDIKDIVYQLNREE